MARPIKNNADYFPHDTDMRNDPKIKALRRKFGVEGYGIYCMAIEYIGDSEYFIADFDKLGIELMAGDFDIDPERLIEIIKYCQSLDLLQLESGELSCNSLENRLNPLLSKRERDRSRVFDSDNTQSKVKESKEKNSKEEESETLLLLGIDNSIDKVLKDEIWINSITPIAKGKDIGGAARASFLYLQGAPNRFKTATLNDLKRVTLSWLENKKSEQKPQDQRERFKNL